MSVHLRLSRRRLIYLKYQLILLLLARQLAQRPQGLPAHQLRLLQILCSNNLTTETTACSNNHPNMADLLL
jgi:hypothetical protein